MSITTYDEPQLRELAKAVIREHIPTANVADLSDYDISARMVAAIGALTQQQAEWLARQIFVGSCDDAFLDDHAASHGTVRKAAIAATGYAIVTGSSAGLTLPASSVLTAVDGVAYATDDSELTAVGSWIPAEIINLIAATLPIGGSRAGGAGFHRVTLNVDVATIAEGDIIAVDGQVNAVRDVVVTLNAIDCHMPLLTPPPDYSVVAPLTGVLVAVTASESGADGNKTGNGVTAEIASAPVGIDSGVLLVGITGGDDIESHTNLRARLVAMETYGALPLTGGGVLAAVLAQEEVGVNVAFVYPNHPPGSHSIVAYGVAGSRELGASSIAKLQAYMESLAPLTVGFTVLPRTNAGRVAVDIVVEAKSGHGADWGDDESVLTVDTGSTLSRVETTTDPTLETGIAAGDRVALALELGNEWVVAVGEISAIDSAGFDLREPLPIAPLSGTTVSPGGPLTVPVWRAVSNYFDTLGPGVAESTERIRRLPDPADAARYDASEARILAAALTVDGLFDVRFTAAFTQPDDVATSTLLLGQTIIRYGSV